MKPTIYLGADHAGFDLKTSIREHLESRGFHVEDLGAHKLDPNDDYPQYAEAVAEAVIDHPGSYGILSCGNAEGITIAANKFDGIRAGIGYSIKAANTMRTDDNTNIMAIPGRIEIDDDPLAVVSAFIHTPFSEAPRHLRRLHQVSEIEERQTRNIKIAPALLEKNEEEFKRKIEHTKLQQLAPLWQIDVLDGSMFNSTCWANVDSIAKMNPLPEIELDLMVDNPLPIITAWKNKILSLRRVIIHAEISQPVEKLLKAIRSMELEVGLAINPNTTIESVAVLAEHVDLLQIMGVHPGKQSQKFLGETILSKLCIAKRVFPDSIISVDGGVNAANARKIMLAGADQLAIGSAIWKATDPETAFHNLKNVLLSR